MFDIDQPYTMAWFLVSLLKTARRLSTCATTIRVEFVHETMVKRGMVLVTLYSSNFVVYGQKHSNVCTRFLRTSGTF